jgi:hypothetical protein
MNDSFRSIYNELSIVEHDEITETQVLSMISDRVISLLERDPDLLMSYLYRLDIDEEKINIALLPFQADEPHIGIAKLILERQKQRAAHKLKYKVEPIEDWED